jgi:cell shape-determining protein MreC
VALLFLLVGLFAPQITTNVSAFLLSPIHGVQTWLRESEAAVPYWFRDRESLVQEIEETKTALLNAQNARRTLNRLQIENLELRSLLSVAPTDRIAAAVIARPPTLPYDFMQIDQGSTAGVVVGAPVFVGDDTVIGVVAYVAPRYALVELFSSPNYQTSVYVTGVNVVATLEGVGGGVARIRVPQGVPIEIGQLVLLPTLEPGEFGRIRAIENAPTQPEQYGYVTPVLGLQSVRVVGVSKNPAVPLTQESLEDFLQSTSSPLFSPSLHTIQVSTSTPTSTPGTPTSTTAVVE